MSIEDIYPDAESSVVSEVYAVIYAPRKSRMRFPANCVEVVGSQQEAVAASNSALNKYPARVLGPSRSSEGLMLYYLVDWLD